MAAICAEYNDAYPTCESTHVTLRIYSDSLSTQEITEAMSLSPTSVQQKGQVRNPEGRRPVTLKLNGWFLSSEGQVDSKDARRHFDWLLDMAGDRGEQLRSLLERGARADIKCYWLSAHSNGGPTLSASQCARLGALGIDCWFDIYFSDDFTTRGSDAER